MIEKMAAGEGYRASGTYILKNERGLWRSAGGIFPSFFSFSFCSSPLPLGPAEDVATLLPRPHRKPPIEIVGFSGHPFFFSLSSTARQSRYILPVMHYWSAL